MIWDGFESPYIHWWRREQGERFCKDYIDVHVPDLSKGQFSGRTLPVPRGSQSPFFRAENPIVGPPPQDPVLNALGGFPTIGDNDLILGIIDTGIALGHRRFRFKDGTTRFIASWQTTATNSNEQENLPFGRELYRDEINKLLEQHSSNQDLQNGHLDESAFNLATSLVEPKRQLGHRDLDYHDAHGTHVLDLAAGFDHSRSHQSKTLTKLGNTWIIAVNLPPQHVHGSAGNFLSLFAAVALERIVFLADKLWDAQHQNKPGKGGFPLAINFSFGRLAGPKDGSSQWEKLVEKKIDERRRKRKAATRLIMPVGNKNLSRGVARETIGYGPANRPLGGRDRVKLIQKLSNEFEVPWRIVPTDHTSNFVEIWPKAQDRSNPAVPVKIFETPNAFALEVKMPGTKSPILVKGMKPGEVRELTPFAHVYCYHPRQSPEDEYPKEPTQCSRAHFVLCVAPTVSTSSSVPEAPAGLWSIKIRYVGTDKSDLQNGPVQEVFCVIQSDQSGVRHANTGRASYFDSANYSTHDETGRIIDSFDPGDNWVDPGMNSEPWDKFGPVQRKGTQNALASWNDVVVIGGYRTSDGRPVSYSSTFDGENQQPGVKKWSNALLPSENSSSLFGLLASGSRDGSVSALQGTSMATALATRTMALAYLSGETNGDLPDEGWWRKSVNKHLEDNTRKLGEDKTGRKRTDEEIEQQRKLNRPFRKYDKLKAGNGRLPMPPNDRLPRLGES